jgi:hypothetical protein
MVTSAFLAGILVGVATVTVARWLALRGARQDR